MRLLQVIHSANPSGGGVIEAVLQLAKTHRRHGHTVEIASLDAPESPWLREFPFPVSALGPVVGSYGYTPKLVSWLRGVCRNYDVAVVNGLWQFSSLGVHQALHGTETPYVVFPHGMLDPWFRTAYPLKHLKKAVYWRLLEHRVLRDARAVFFTCEEERELARQTFRPYRCREVVSPLGTELPEESADLQRAAFFARFPLLRGKRLMLFLGRLHDKKGCDLLLRAFAEVARSNPTEPDLHLVMAGPPASESYLAELQQLSAHGFTGAQPPVTWTGMLSGHEKWGAYRAAEVFILPSHQENFGLSVIEALACELPVLISNRINIWREISADGAGLVERDDQAGTTKLLRDWMALPPTAQQAMRHAARTCFTQRFESERAGLVFIERLDELLHFPQDRPKPLPVPIVS